MTTRIYVLSGKTLHTIMVPTQRSKQNMIIDAVSILHEHELIQMGASYREGETNGYGYECIVAIPLTPQPQYKEDWYIANVHRVGHSPGYGQKLSWRWVSTKCKSPDPVFLNLLPGGSF